MQERCAMDKRRRRATLSTAATENGVLGQSGVTPYDLGASHLRQYVRQLPLSRTHREARRIQDGLWDGLYTAALHLYACLCPEPPAPVGHAERR